MGFTDIVTLIYRIIANVGLITEVINKLAPIFPQLTDLWNILSGKGSAQAYDVSWLQTSLNTLGATPPLTVDGVYGALTQAAVKAYQQKAGVTVDGWAGVETTAKLLTDLGGKPQ